MPVGNILWNTTVSGGGGGGPVTPGTGGTVVVNLDEPTLNNPGASVGVKFDFTGSTFDVVQNTGANTFDPAVHEIEVYTTIDDDIPTFNNVLNLPLTMRSRTSYLGHDFRIMFSSPGLKTMTHFFVETASGKTTTAQSTYLVETSRAVYDDDTEIVLWNPAGDTDFSHASAYSGVAAGNRVSANELTTGGPVWTAVRGIAGNKALIITKPGGNYSGQTELSVSTNTSDHKHVTIESSDGTRFDLVGASDPNGSKTAINFGAGYGGGTIYDWRLRNFNATGGFDASTNIPPSSNNGRDQDFVNISTGVLLMVDDFSTTDFTHHFLQSAVDQTTQWGMHLNDGIISGWGGQYGCVFCGVNSNLATFCFTTGVQMIQPQDALSNGNLYRATIRLNGCYNQGVKSCDVQNRDLSQPAFKAHEDPLIDGGKLNVTDSHFQGGLEGLTCGRNAGIGNLDRSVILSARVARCSFAGSPNMQKFFFFQASGILLEDNLIVQPNIPFYNVALRWFVDTNLVGTSARDFPIVIRNNTFVSERTSANNNGGTVTEVDASGFTNVVNQNNIFRRQVDGAVFNGLDDATDFRQLQDTAGYRLSAGGGYEANTQGASSMKTYAPTTSIALASGSISPGSLGGQQKRDLAASRSVVGAWVGV